MSVTLRYYKRTIRLNWSGVSRGRWFVVSQLSTNARLDELIFCFRFKELLCLLRPRQKYPLKSLAPMYQRQDNAYDVKQHFTANGPGREFARDVRAQILGVMVLLLGPARQVMAGDTSASSRPDHLF